MKNRRFKTIYTQDNIVDMITIIEDIETEKRYILIYSDKYAALCPMQ